MSIERRVTRLEGATIGGHVTLARLLQVAREGGTYCRCPRCTTMVAELVAKARANRTAREGAR